MLEPRNGTSPPGFVRIEPPRTAGAQKPRALVIAKRASAAEGLQQIIAATLEHLRGNTPAALSGDAEALRQSRAALRRLREALRLFAPLLALKKARFDAPLRGFARTLGAARDWDVFCLDTLPAAMADLPGVDFTVLRALAEGERRAAHGVVDDLLRGPELAALAGDLTGWAAAGARRPRANGPRRLGKRLSRRVPGMLEALAGEAARLGRHPGRLSEAGLHEFRKALNRLNIGLRFLGGAYPPDRVSAYRKASRAVRDIIGPANDAEVTRGLVSALVGGRPDLQAQAAALAAWGAARQSAALAGLKPAARRFRAAPEFWRE